MAQPGRPPWEEEDDELPPWETDDDPEWRAVGTVEINDRTGEKRPARKFAGAALGIGKVEDPYPGVQKYLAGIPQVIARVKQGISTLPEVVASSMDYFLPAGVKAGNPSEVYGHDNPVRRAVDDTHEDYRQKKEELAQHGAAQGWAPWQTAGADTALEGLAVVADPTNFIPTSKATKALRGVGELDDLAKVSARVVDPDLAALAKQSLDIGAEKPIASVGPVRVVEGPAQGPIRNLQAVDEAGNVVGEMRLTVEPGGGFKVNEVTTQGKGTGAGRAMYQAAAEQHGPYQGSLAQTAEGEGFVNRLRETDPEVFAGPPKAGPLLLPAQANPAFEYNLDRLGVDDALKPELNRVLREELDDKLPGAGGGSVVGLQGKLADPAVVDSLARKLGMTPEDLAKRRPGYVLDTSGAAVLDAGLTSTTTKLEALVRDLAAGKIPPAGLEAANEEIAKLRYKRNLLVIASSGNASEQGRALGARRFTVPGLSQEDALRSQINRKYKLTPEQTDALAKLDPSRPEDVNTFLRGVDNPELKGMVTSLWRASILSGVPTQLRNILGNTTQLAWELGIRPLTAALEVPVRKSGRALELLEHRLKRTPAADIPAPRPPAARMQDIPQAFIGAYDGTRAGFGKALQVLKTGMSPETAGKMDLARANPFDLVKNPVGRALGKAATEPVFRTLSAADAFFRTIGWTSRQYEAAARFASLEGKPMAEMMLDPRVLKEAEEFSKRVTYQDTPSKFAQGIASAAKGLDEVVGVPVGTFAVPFTSVPDRVMARAFEATPAGLMTAAWKAAKNDPMAAEGLAKGAVGTAVAYWAYGHAKEGLLTAAAPRDAAERSQFYALGAQPWSAKVGDRWIPYSQLGPLGFTMAMAAQVAEYNEQTGDDDSVPDQLLTAGLGAANYVLDQSYVDNLQKLAETLGSNGDVESRRKSLGRFVNQSAAGFVPYSALQRNVAQSIDQRVTDPDTLGETIAANTPFLSRDVPAKMTPFGEDVTRQETPLGAFLPRNTPLYALAQNSTPADPVEAELARIGVALTFVQKKVGSEKRGTKRPLSEEERRSYQQDSGEAIRTRLQDLFASPTYAGLSDVQKSALVSQFIELERKRSRIKLFGP